MLKKPTALEAEAYMDTAYTLALDPSRSGYPTYADGIKTKADFLECCRWGLTRPDREVLLYLENGRVCGWIQSILEPESRYLETNIFNIAGDTAAALAEYIRYCGENHPGYRLCFGFPGENRAAIDYLESRDWLCEERSFNDVLCFDEYTLLPEDGNVTRVTRANFSLFRTLHESVQGTMYWNADRLYEALDQWDIWMLEENGTARAAIYNRDAEILMHIYGVDYRDGVYDPQVYARLLAKALNECKRNGKRYMVLFSDEETQDIVLDLGFRCVGEYILFTATAEDPKQSQ